MNMEAHMRRPLFFFASIFLALPLSAQAWDLRLEVPFPKGQSLQGTMVSGTVDLAVSGDLDTGNGAIFTVNHRLFRVGPVLRLDWGGEVGQLTADGVVDIGTSAQQKTKLRQTGVGLGLNALLSVPLLGLSGEIGAIQRFQKYEYTTEGAEHSGAMGRLWLRVGVRYKLNLLVASPYVTASYQQPINKDNPVKIGSIEDLQGLFSAQGKGQEFQRMWTFGVGVMF
jgi:hypothetical protein